MLISQKLLPSELFEHYKVLWTGTCNKGNTVTLNDSIKNYNAVFIRLKTDVTYVMCPIIQNTNVVRGSNIFIADSNNFLQFLTVKGVCDTTSFTLTNMVILRLTASGSVTDYSSEYTYISEIIGVR